MAYNKTMNENYFTKIFVVVLLTAVTFALCLAGYNVFLALSHPIKYQNEIIKISKKYNLSASLIASMINVESSYDINAKSSKGACGLMQIKLDTANYVAEIYNLDYLNENDLYIANINIEYGALYLKYLINKFDILDTAIIAYNAGETVVRNWLNSGVYSTDKKSLNYIPYAETRNYLEKIKDNIKYYNKLY